MTTKGHIATCSSQNLIPSHTLLWFVDGFVCLHKKKSERIQSNNAVLTIASKYVDTQYQQNSNVGVGRVSDVMSMETSHRVLIRSPGCNKVMGILFGHDGPVYSDKNTQLGQSGRFEQCHHVSMPNFVTCLVSIAFQEQEIDDVVQVLCEPIYNSTWNKCIPGNYREALATG